MDPLNLNAINFKTAFLPVSYDSVKDEFKTLDDPEFVKIVVRLISYSEAKGDVGN